MRRRRREARDVPEASRSRTAASACFLWVMSRVIADAPISRPSGSQIGDTVTDTSIRRPSRVTRTVS